MTERRHLSSLTSARALAASFVLIHHARGAWRHYDWVDYVGSIGWLGVSFFFILSGFVLMWTFDPSVNAKVFFQKRVCRIYPLHLATLLFSLLVFAVCRKPLGGFVGTGPGTILNFALVHGWVPGHPEIRQAWNGVSWTLSCELFFYVCALFFFRWLMRVPPSRAVIVALLSWIVVASAALVAATFGLASLDDFLVFFPLPRFLEFGIGAVSAYVLRLQLTSIKDIVQAKWLSLIVVSFTPICIYLWSHPESIRTASIMIAAVIPPFTTIIVYLALSDALDAHRWFRWLSYKPLVILGDSSFALYMTHALILPIGLWVTRQIGLWPKTPFEGELLTLFFSAVCLLFAVFVYRRFEVPMRRKTMSLSTVFLNLSRERGLDAK